MTFKDRELVFCTARNIHSILGDIAQNEYEFSHLDLVEEFIMCDKLIERINNYKQIVITNIVI